MDGNLIFDTHAHYDDAAFDSDRDELLSSLPERGVCGVVNCGTDVKTSAVSLALAEKYPFVYAACGIHPEECEKIQPGDFAALTSLLQRERAVAVGEIGLDHHWDIPNELQREIFERQLKMAVQLDLPVIVHDREAHGETLELLKKYRPKGVLHSFSGSVEMAKDVLSIGMYLGFGGAVTFKKAKKVLEVLEVVPFDRLLLETDCPYMAPEPYRGRRNDSTFIKFAVERIAEVKGVDPGYVISESRQAAKTLFGV